MTNTEEALLKGLVHLIWADGEVSDDERELLGGVLIVLGLSEEEIEKVGHMMTAPPALGDLKASVPDQNSRIEIMKVLIAAAFADGNVHKKELRFLDKMAIHLDITHAELEALKASTQAAVEEAQ